MASDSTSRSADALLIPDPGLVSAATYRRSIGASLERVWENVLDWEHLPWLHRSSFDRLELRAAGDWGWRAEVGYPGNPAGSEIELRVDRPAGRYVTRSIAGSGAGTEIWTSLLSAEPHVTEIEVDFRVGPLGREALTGLGHAYVGLYTRLWDEDEEMMKYRERALRARVREEGAGAVLDLGAAAALAARAPVRVELEGQPFWILEIGGSLQVRSGTCPHWLGPLEVSAAQPDRLACPWHGYAFDAEQGSSCDGRGLRLATDVRLEIDAGGRARLVRAG